VSGLEVNGGSLKDAIAVATSDFKVAGLQFDEDVVRRFVASLLAKQFVILTGLSGSGKTRLAQAFAAWASHEKQSRYTRFGPGARIRADRMTYVVSDSDRLSAEFWNQDDPAEAVRVSLPWALIDEWVDCILRHGFTRATPARTIRELVDTEHGHYSRQLNSFETILKAAAFALLESEQRELDTRNYELVAVGADWTSNESVAGYADALHAGRFVRTQALDLILRAVESPNQPYFLILDEMNLSHVERYFADFLSAMESGEPIVLHAGTEVIDGVPPKVPIPRNMFIVGTVNVDETTYMFSPKVLDRANTIEFRVDGSQIEAALLNHAPVNLGAIIGRGSSFLADFVGYANQPLPIASSHVAALVAEATLLFDILEEHGHEFGYRVAQEIARFFGALRLLSAEFDASYAIDAQIYQKILPRLSGSQAQLEPLLIALASYCVPSRDWQGSGSDTLVLRNGATILDAARKASENFDESVFDGTQAPAYPLSHGKLRRMHKRLQRNGFTSFAEA
jgi:hypothetical protein